MKIAYFDCFAGASGDMILGALLDAGLEIETLKTELAKLGLSNYDVQVKKVLKRGIRGSQAMVIIDPPVQHNDHKTDLFDRHMHYHHHGNHNHSDPHHDHSKDDLHHRNLHDITKIIENSRLSPSVKKKSLQVFTRLAEAEAKVHRTSIEQIHFHEVGGMDAIIDVVGGVAGMESMGIEAVYCSPLHVGSGTVECAHGTLPVPAPATLELICGKPIYSTGVTGELLTPTGAAILTTLASGFGPMPEMIVESIGYGSGEKDLSIPNLLRISIGVSNAVTTGYQTERVGVVETNIDDMNPQIYDYLIEKLFRMGVMDTYLVPVQMKKNRPGTLVTVLCSPEMVGKVADFLIRETTSIGLRYRIDHRIKAHRRIEKVETPFGPIRYKVASLNGGEVLNVFPEYEDCKRVALENGVPLKKVIEMVNAAASKNEICKVT
jgi:pyridinium-3,5-bisthiocarboxylic acid mononucleotide nickel chelatase